MTMLDQIKYSEFMKINEITDCLLRFRYSAIYALNAKNVSGYDKQALEEAKWFNQIEHIVLYNDSRIFLRYEEGRIKWYGIYMESRRIEALGIKTELGNYYGSTKITVPLGNYTATFEIRLDKRMDITNKTILHEVGVGKDYHTELFKVNTLEMSGGLSYLTISIAEYAGSAKYKSTMPFDGYDAVDKRNYELLGIEDVQIDGHTATKYTAYHIKNDDYYVYAILYALDANTFVMIVTDKVDYDKDVSLLIETLHIDKK
jgi:hypothetical protein